jgi:hypothetical protein
MQVIGTVQLKKETHTKWNNRHPLGMWLLCPSIVMDDMSDIKAMNLKTFDIICHCHLLWGLFM